MKASVFYDSGAQVSRIRTALAERLNLESKPIKIVIRKVGGVEEDLDTRLYKVCVCGDSESKCRQLTQQEFPKYQTKPRIQMSTTFQVLLVYLSISCAVRHVQSIF